MEAQGSQTPTIMVVITHNHTRGGEELISWLDNVIRTLNLQGRVDNRGFGVGPVAGGVGGGVSGFGVDGVPSSTQYYYTSLQPILEPWLSKSYVLQYWLL